MSLSEEDSSSDNSSEGFSGVWDTTIQILKSHSHDRRGPFEESEHFARIGCLRGFALGVEAIEDKKGLFGATVTHRCQGPVVLSDEYQHPKSFAQLADALNTAGELLAVRLAFTGSDSAAEWRKVLDALRVCKPLVKTVELVKSYQCDDKGATAKLLEVVDIVKRTFPSIDTFWFSADDASGESTALIKRLKKFKQLRRVVVEFGREIDRSLVRELCAIRQIKHVNVHATTLSHPTFTETKATFDERVLVHEYLPEKRTTALDRVRAKAACRFHAMHKEQDDSSSEYSY